MTGLVRKATLLTVCGLFVAAAAMAGVPSPSNSVKPGCVRYVGLKTNVVDPAGQFTVTVKDLQNNPIANSLVVIDYSTCPDSHAGTQANQTFAGVTVDGTAKTVRALTNGVGVATFRIAGAALAAGGAVGANCGKIFADGVLLGNVTVNAFDQDGTGGVALPDLSLWAQDDFLLARSGGGYVGRSDYDCTGSVALPDLSIWASVFFSTNSSASATAFAW